jgi:hypothetical protein
MKLVPVFIFKQTASHRMERKNYASYEFSSAERISQLVIFYQIASAGMHGMAH